VWIVAGEQSVEILRVHELVAHERGGVGVVGNVLAEERVGVPALTREDIVDEAAEERDVGAGRRAAWISDVAEVRVKRGSTWMPVAPRCLACITKRNAIG